LMIKYGRPMLIGVGAVLVILLTETPRYRHCKSAVSTHHKSEDLLVAVKKPLRCQQNARSKGVKDGRKEKEKEGKDRRF
jgi:hypothetical protein